jgi:dihydroorotate dehydrogenase (fumarate)
VTELATNYMGLELRNPLVASPSPLSYTLDGVQRLADGGVGAIVLYSLFEEQLREQQARIAELVQGPAESFPEALDYVPEVTKKDPGPRTYLSLLERAAAAIDVPVIASLNGSTPEGWTGYALQMQEAGAAASVPVAVKLSPYFSSIGEMASRLDEAGADGLVLFNRFLQPDIDPDEFVVLPRVTLSSPAEGRLPRAWIALLHGLSSWMERKGFAGVRQVRGMLAVPAQADRDEFERAGYVAAMRAANAGAYLPS